MKHTGKLKFASLIAAAFAAAATAFAGRADDCLSELMAIGQEGTNAFGRMASAIKEADEAAGELHSRLETLQSLKDTYREINKGYTKVVRKIEEADTQTRKDAGFRGTIRKTLEGHFAKESAAKAKYDACVNDEGGVRRLKGRVENAQQDFSSASHLWKVNLEKAQSHYYKCRERGCERYYRETYDSLRPTVENHANSMQTINDRVRDDYAEISSANEAVRDAQGDCEAVPDRIAGLLDFDAASDMESLLAELTKKQVRFLVDGKIWLVKSLDANEPLSYPDTVPETMGKVFLWWQIENRHEEFKGFNNPVAADLRLEAAWGYRLYPDGAKGELIPDWDPKVSKGVLDQFGIPGKEGFDFVGWEDDEGNIVREGSPIHKNTRISPKFREIEREVLWYHEGNNIARTVYKAGDAVQRRALPCGDCLYWVDSPDGKQEWDGFDKPLAKDGIKLYAVHEVVNEPPVLPQADFNIVIHSDDGSVFRTLGVKTGSALPVAWLNNNVPPKPKSVFVGFSPEISTEMIVDKELHFTASYRPSTWRDDMASLRKKFPAPALLVADILLLALVFPLGLIGRKSGKAE